MQQSTIESNIGWFLICYASIIHWIAKTNALILMVNKFSPPMWPYRENQIWWKIMIYRLCTHESCIIRPETFIQKVNYYSFFINTDGLNSSKVTVDIFIILHILYISSTTVEHQVNIFKLFLKDHVTLKTGIMAAKKQLCITGINYIWKYIKIEKLF